MTQRTPERNEPALAETSEAEAGSVQVAKVLAWIAATVPGQTAEAAVIHCACQVCSMLA